MAKKKFAKIGDGFQPELIREARLDGLLQMPTIDPEKEIRVPKVLVPYSRVKYCNESNKYCVFYEHDINFAEVLENPESENCIEVFKSCDGIITPDCSTILGAPILAQVMNIYRSRAIGAEFQAMGLYTIANVRWGDERTYTTCLFPEPPAFLGVPKNFIVSIGSYGACKNRTVRKHFRDGLVAMLDYLKPKVVLVYGPMPKTIFSDLTNRTEFIHYDDWTTLKHRGAKNGYK